MAKTAIRRVIKASNLPPATAVSPGSMPATRMAQSVFVEDYFASAGGAIGGSSDCSAAFQAAVTAAALTPGKTVQLLEGPYLLLSQVVVPIGVQILGNAAPISMDTGIDGSTTQSPVATKGTLLLSSVPGGVMNFFKLLGRNRVARVAFDSTTAAPTLTRGATVDMSDACGIELDSIYIHRAWDGLFCSNTLLHYNGIHVTNYSAQNCKNAIIHLNDATGFFVDHYDWFTAQYVETSIGLLIDDRAASVYLDQGCMMGGYQAVQMGTGINDDIRISNSAYDSIRGHGIRLNNCTNSTIQSMWVASNWGHGIIIDGTCMGVKLSNVIALNNKFSGIYVASNLVNDLTIDGCSSYANNYGNNPGEGGIRLCAGLSNFDISHCLASNSNSYGLPNGHQKFGILLPDGASDNYVITSNRIAGNENDVGVIDGGTGTNKNVSNNLGPWSPGDVPDCALWVRASVGVTPATGTITALVDQSGNNIPLTPVGSPTVSASTINGLPGIVISAYATQALTNATTRLCAQNAARYMIAVAKPAATGGGSYAAGGRLFDMPSQGAFSATFTALLSRESSQNTAGYSDSATFISYLAGNPVIQDTPFIYELTALGGVGNGKVTVKLNGTAYALGNSAEQVAEANNVGFVLGNGAFAGHGANQGFQGTICEFMFFSVIPSAANLALLKAYFAAKYAISVV